VGRAQKALIDAILDGEIPATTGRGARVRGGHPELLAAERGNRPQEMAPGEGVDGA